MISRNNLILVLYLTFVLLFVSCGKENKESGKGNDSTKSGISASNEKIDTPNVISENKSITKEEAVQKEECKNQKGYIRRKKR